MFNGKTQQIVVVGAVFFLMMACALPKTTPVATMIPSTTGDSATTAVPIVKAATLTPVIATETPATPPTVHPTLTSVPPSATLPAPVAAVETSGAVRLKFSLGATDTYVSTAINSDEIKKYLVQALKGQMMMLQLQSADSNVVFDLTGVSDGVKLATNSAIWNTWLPLNQDYLISVKPQGGSTNFTLVVTVPVNINFASGAISETLDGSVRDHAINTYLARANKNQAATVKITSPSTDVLLTIYGLEDGSPLVRYVSGASSWSGVLPATQVYVIQAVSVGSATDYTIKVTIK